ncbi:MAG: AAA family ATPase, partial [Clostridia bacterium]|nr:AAA family ATPase [Clostridia bacterium]
MKNAQLADLLRPSDFDGIVGQEHLFGERGVVRRMLSAGRITNMIFFGPPGTGKTTAASIIAKSSGMTFHKLNATSATLSDVKDIIAQTGNIFGSGGILLYLDEIQYFNRKQQQALLEYMEDGRITLIASTTENPHFFIYNAILSRSSLFEFKPVGATSLRP